VLTGHSLGGALALLLAAKLCLIGRPPASVITFGAPHVSIGGEMADLFDVAGLVPQMYRHGADCVPLLPPTEFGWLHPAPLIPIGHPATGILAGEVDHAVARYCAALEMSAIPD